MEILGYGEDALTLWGMKYKLSDILNSQNDPSNPERCKIFFRPSFGRAGGDKSAQFGEFDFIILSDDFLYLGESKWDRSHEKIADGCLILRPEQLLRHRVFYCLIQLWLDNDYICWSHFKVPAEKILRKESVNKQFAPENSLLAKNLEMTFNIIKGHYKSIPQIKNLLLYFHCNKPVSQLPKKAGNDFNVVSLDYSMVTLGNYIQISI
ncbi:MAG: hypothetical protein P4L50_30310 [Anaerolineaceae bacterium]|nr:hypothetical protein [Anaerolineaceae bacterium]